MKKHQKKDGGFIIDVKEEKDRYYALHSST